MKVGDDYFLKPKQHTRQRRTQYRRLAAVDFLALILFFIQIDKITSFQTVKKSCRVRHFTGGLGRIIRKNRTISSRLFGSGTDIETMTTKDDNKASNPLSRLGLPKPLLLGSASFTRKLILKEMGIPYSKFVRPIDEKALGDRSDNAPPRELVLLLANAKMDRLVQELTENAPDDLPEQSGNKGWVILTGDQVVTCDGQILEKPVSIEEAKKFVRGYAKSPPSTVGSVVLYHHPSGIRVDGVDTATIHFNPETLGGDGSSVLIDSLVEQKNPL